MPQFGCEIREAAEALIVRLQVCMKVIGVQNREPSNGLRGRADQKACERKKFQAEDSVHLRMVLKQESIAALTPVPASVVVGANSVAASPPPPDPRNEPDSR
jgi:hypothetical protein